MKQFLSLFLLLISGVSLFAQYPGGGGGNRGGRLGGMNIGHFYGKAVDSKTNKGIPGVTVQLVGNKFDTATKQLKQGVILKTVITENNGDFSLEGLPVFGNFKLKISAVGYKKIEKPVAFNIKMPQQGGATAPTGGLQEGNGGGGSTMQQALGQADKDLGNIKMEIDETDLGNVTVTSSAKPLMELGIDKKIFNVDKNLNSTGQTATEIMKTIPSLNVDIDGNVTMRNATPTIFVDGRPTTMTLDQMPADIIDKIEMITNPSAKYDASGGNAGILNIILKKNRKNGYNGGLRAGVDSRGKLNGGGDFNFRQNKLNFFASGNYNQRKSISTSNNNQTLYSADTTTSIASDNGTNNGSFGFGRAGFDYFVDNRNTISVTANYNKGHFHNEDTQLIDTSINQIDSSHTNRYTNSTSNFQNFGGQLSFKHNFAKNGHDITADANYNSSTSSSNSNITSNVYQPNGTSTKYPAYLQQGVGNGSNHFLTLQSDYENPITDDSKFEAGVRAAIRDFKTINLQYINDNTTTNGFVLNPSASSRYKFNDQVYAAYANYSAKIKRFSYQVGLRIESSNYTGRLLSAAGGDSSAAPFKVSYPLGLFPSVFITYKVDSKQDVQLNYSRRVNRPNFFQLIPSYDFTNPQSPSVGNPDLKPEFTSSFEMSYNNNYSRGSNFLATVFFKYTTDLLTRYIYKDIDRNTAVPNPTDSLYYTTYVNANNSYSYGLELTNKNAVTKWWDLTLNINFFNSVINATLPNQTVSNNQLSWFGKMNNSIKIGKGWSFQFSGDYQSKSLIPQNSGGGQGGGGRGGGMFGGGGQQALAQGYILPRYSLDAAIRKDWTWKNGQSGSLTLGMNDIFRTQLYKTTASSVIDAETLIQETERRRDPQVLRLNFSYRFGKFDATLFKRKNTKSDQGGMDMMGGGNG